MPLVKEQVRSQIKVVDLSRASVSIHPADYQSWQQAADKLVAEGLGPINKKRAEEIAAMSGDDAMDGASVDARAAINAKYDQMQKDHESRVLNQPLSFFVELGTTYNFL